MTREESISLFYEWFAEETKGMDIVDYLIFVRIMLCPGKSEKKKSKAIQKSFADYAKKHIELPY